MATTLVTFNAEYAPRIRMIRNRVFTAEQHVDPDIDFDGRDREAIHLLVFYKGTVAGTGRMLKDGHIGRLADPVRLMIRVDQVKEALTLLENGELSVTGISLDKEIE